MSVWVLTKRKFRCTASTSIHQNDTTKEKMHRGTTTLRITPRGDHISYHTDHSHGDGDGDGGCGVRVHSQHESVCGSTQVLVGKEMFTSVVQNCERVEENASTHPGWMHRLGVLGPLLVHPCSVAGRSGHGPDRTSSRGPHPREMPKHHDVRGWMQLPSLATMR